MSKLTKAQTSALMAAANGQLVRHFDVYGGYWWTREDDAPVHKRTVEVLEFDQKLVERGPDERVFSGRQKSTYRITDLGRAALSNRGEHHD